MHHTTPNNRAWRTHECTEKPIAQGWRRPTASLMLGSTPSSSSARRVSRRCRDSRRSPAVATAAARCNAVRPAKRHSSGLRSQQRNTLQRTHEGWRTDVQLRPLPIVLARHQAAQPPNGELSQPRGHSLAYSGEAASTRRASGCRHAAAWSQKPGCHVTRHATTNAHVSSSRRSSTSCWPWCTGLTKSLERCVIFSSHGPTRAANPVLAHMQQQPERMGR